MLYNYTIVGWISHKISHHFHVLMFFVFRHHQITGDHQTIAGLAPRPLRLRRNRTTRGYELPEFQGQQTPGDVKFVGIL